MHGGVCEDSATSLVCADVCRRMPTYADVCQRMHGGVCEDSATSLVPATNYIYVCSMLIARGHSSARAATAAAAVAARRGRVSGQSSGGRTQARRRRCVGRGLGVEVAAGMRTRALPQSR